MSSFKNLVTLFAVGGSIVGGYGAFRLHQASTSRSSMNMMVQSGLQDAGTAAGPTAYKNPVTAALADLPRGTGLSTAPENRKAKAQPPEVGEGALKKEQKPVHYAARDEQNRGIKPTHNTPQPFDPMAQQSRPAEHPDSQGKFIPAASAQQSPHIRSQEFAAGATAQPPRDGKIGRARPAPRHPAAADSAQGQSDRVDASEADLGDAVDLNNYAHGAPDADASASAAPQDHAESVEGSASVGIPVPPAPPAPDARASSRSESFQDALSRGRSQLRGTPSPASSDAAGSGADAASSSVDQGHAESVEGSASAGIPVPPAPPAPEVSASNTTPRAELEQAIASFQNKRGDGSKILDTVAKRQDGRVSVQTELEQAIKRNATKRAQKPHTVDEVQARAPTTLTEDMGAFAASAAEFLLNRAEERVFESPDSNARDDDDSDWNNDAGMNQSQFFPVSQSERARRQKQEQELKAQAKVTPTVENSGESSTDAADAAKKERAIAALEQTRQNSARILCSTLRDGVTKRRTPIEGSDENNDGDDDWTEEDEDQSDQWAAFTPSERQEIEHLDPVSRTEEGNTSGKRNSSVYNSALSFRGDQELGQSVSTWASIMSNDPRASSWPHAQDDLCVSYSGQTDFSSRPQNGQSTERMCKSADSENPLSVSTASKANGQPSFNDPRFNQENSNAALSIKYIWGKQGKKSNLGNSQGNKEYDYNSEDLRDLELSTGMVLPPWSNFLGLNEYEDDD